MDLATMAALAFSTLISEDLATIGAALLARDGHLPLAHAVLACVAGVYLGDLGLWLAGRTFGRRLLAVPWIQHRLPPVDLAAIGARLDARVATTVLVSRFVPGSRLPTYVAAGILGRRPFAFALWSLVAVTVWTPLLIVATVYFGSNVVAPLVQGIEVGVLGSLITSAVAVGAIRLLGTAASGVERITTSASTRRSTRQSDGLPRWHSIAGGRSAPAGESSPG